MNGYGNDEAPEMSGSSIRRGGARQMSSQLTGRPARSSGVGTTAELIALLKPVLDRLDPEVHTTRSGTYSIPSV